jgi:hypothetical protein
MGELAVIKPSVPAFSMGDVEKIAGAIARSGMFGLKDPYGVLTLCLLAQAEGQHPAVVFRDYSVISGKPAKKAEAMLRDFINSGGKVEWHTLDDECADATFSHPAGSARISWDKERAKKAGLGGNGMYAKYPRQMLRSRVISEGVRTVYPGATSGLYVPEEVSTFENVGEASVTINPETGEITDATSGPAPRTKLGGPHTSKTALKKAIHDIANSVMKAKETAEIDAALKSGKETIKQAERDWPELLTGDPNLEGDDEGLKRLVARRREELTPKEESLGFQMLCSAVQEARSSDDLRSLIDEHADAIAALDGTESRDFENFYNAKEGALRNPEPLTAGEYGA